MEFNAQTAGVKPGGLNNTEQIKLLVCFLLQNFDRLDENILLEAVFDGGLANPFEMYRALAVLKEKGMIAEQRLDGKIILSLNSEGERIINELVHMLPKSVRENSLVLVNDLLCLKKWEGETSFDLTEAGDEYYMSCTINDGSCDLLTLRLLVPNRDVANDMRQNILKSNPALIYKSIISLLGNDVEGFLEYFDDPKISNWSSKDFREEI